MRLESFALDAAFEGSFLFKQVERYAVEQREVLRRVACSFPVQIFAKAHVEHPVQFVVSRPEGSHPQPLSERCGSLSTHTAPIRQTRPAFHSANAQTGAAESLPRFRGRGWPAPYDL